MVKRRTTINTYITPEVYQMFIDYQEELELENSIDGNYLITIEEMKELKLLMQEDARKPALTKVINRIEGAADYFIFLEKEDDWYINKYDRPKN